MRTVKTRRTRRTRRRVTTTESYYKDLPIMTDKERGLSADKEILDKIEDQFEYAERNKSKIFFMRYDVRFPQGEQEHTDNKLFSSFQSNFIKHLKREGLKPQYLAVREQSREKHQHYHVGLWLDGNKTQNIYHHIEVAESLWRSQLGIEEGKGLIDDCTTSRSGDKQVNGVMLRQRDTDYSDKKKDCFRRMSYLAKVNTKSNTPRRQREVFSSRIPKK